MRSASQTCLGLMQMVNKQETGKLLTSLLEFCRSYENLTLRACMAPHKCLNAGDMATQQETGKVLTIRACVWACMAPHKCLNAGDVVAEHETGKLLAVGFALKPA